MISAKIYFRSGKGAYINLSGDEVDELKTILKPGAELVLCVEDGGNELVLKTKVKEKSIKK